MVGLIRAGVRERGAFEANHSAISFQDPRLAPRDSHCIDMQRSVSRCFVDVDLGASNLTTLASIALLVQTWLLLGACSAAAKGKSDASYKESARKAPLHWTSW